MEQEIATERAGTVKKIFVKEGDVISAGDVIMQIL